MKYITIVGNPEKARGKKTQVLDVFTSDGNDILGEIKWFSQWRCYSFFPCHRTIYEKRCLRDIADFCESLTNEHRRLTKELKDLNLLMSGMFK